MKYTRGVEIRRVPRRNTAYRRRKAEGEEGEIEEGRSYENVIDGIGERENFHRGIISISGGEKNCTATSRGRRNEFSPERTSAVIQLHSAE